MNGWELPVHAVIGGTTYELHADYRDILEIFSYFEDPDLPEYIRWQVALALFYEGQIPPQHRQQAMEYLVYFLNCGRTEQAQPAAKLLDWQQDALLIVADVNKVAGLEIRELPFLHWWSFMAWFHAIGQGQLSTVVAIRDKLRRGKALEDWEKVFYREHKALVDLKPRYSRQQLQEKERLEQLLAQ